MRRARWGWALVAAVPAVFIGYFFVYPVVRILALGLSEMNIGSTGLEARLVRIGWFTLWQAALSTVLTLLFAAPMTWAISRFEFRGRRMATALVTIPFVLPRYDNYYRQFPECRENIERPPSEIMRELYYDTVTMHAPALKCALETLGPEQLVFGSDYPHVPGGIDRFVTVLESVGMSEEHLEMVGRSNALDLIGLGDARAAGSR